MFEFVVVASVELDFVKIGTFHHPKPQPRSRVSRHQCHDKQNYLFKAL
jgi:hypothetical protein